MSEDFCFELSGGASQSDTAAMDPPGSGLQHGRWSGEAERVSVARKLADNRDMFHRADCEAA